MKINSIHIENFGTLSDKTFDFNGGCTCIIQENGWGKSTLSSFIRIMFFGFENERAKALLDRERYRFKPWQGGVYGGSIIFEHEGKEYKFTRQFGEKAIGDSFELYDNKTKLVSNDFSSSIGEELFKIDAESFRRTVLIAQNDIDTNPTDRIHARIGNIAETTDDITNFETIESKLKDELNRISSSRSTGEIRRLSDGITVMETEIKNSQGLDNKIKDTTNSIEAKKAKRKEISAHRRKLQTAHADYEAAATLLERKKAYDKAASENKQRKEAYEELLREFPFGVPSYDGLKSNILLAKVMEGMADECNRAELSEHQQRLLSSNAAAFSAGIPDAEELEKYSRLLERLSEDKDRYERLQLSEDEENEYSSLNNVFAGKENVEHDVAKLTSGWNERNKKANALEGKKTALQMARLALANNTPEKDNSVPILLIAGFFLLVAGAVLAVVLKPAIIGVLIVIVGIVPILLGFLSSKKAATAAKMPRPEDEQIVSMENTIISDENSIADTDRRVKAFLDVFHIPFDETSVSEELFVIGKKFERYGNLLQKKKNAKNEELLTAIRNREEDLDRFLNSYELLFADGDDTRSRLLILKHKSSDYKEALEASQRLAGLKAAFEKKNAPLLSYISSIGIPRAADETPLEFLNRISSRSDILKKAGEEYERASKNVADLESAPDFEKVREAKEITFSMTADEFNAKLSEGNARDEELVDDINAETVQLNNMLDQKDRLDRLLENLADSKEKRDELLEKERILKLTKDLLQEAKTEFTQEYAAPVTEAFREYYNLLDGSSSANYEFDANSNLVITDRGKVRDISVYSAGSKDKINLCFRLALIKAMFKDELPPLIMDDPFTNLDKEHLSGAKILLEEIAKDYQVLYFTCHESREVV